VKLDLGDALLVLVVSVGVLWLAVVLGAAVYLFRLIGGL
jgi:hypothetical protein